MNFKELGFDAAKEYGVFSCLERKNAHLSGDNVKIHLCISSSVCCKVLSTSHACIVAGGISCWMTC